MDGDIPRLPELSPADQRLFDALVECEFEPDALNLSVEDRKRAETILNLLGLLNDYPVDDADDSLIDATLARVDREERRRSDRMRIDADERGRRGGILARLRSPDFISVAAVILIGASVGLPMMHWLRQSSIDASCANNMRLMSYAFGNYAADFNGAVPVVQAGLFPVWDSGTQNAAVNLRPLIELGYCEHGHLDCAGHDGAGPDYSYQWQVDGAKPRWMFGRPTLLLGDQNPVISGMRRGVQMSMTAPSLNHGGRGQNVLSSDGSTMWLERSVIGNDNIWLPAGVTYLYDGVRPEGAGDVFLAH